MFRDTKTLADTLFNRLALDSGATLTVGRSAEQLWQFTLDPPRAGAAKIDFVVSWDEVILSSGEGTRFELESLPNSEEEILRLVGAISGGGLSEQIWPRRVRYELRFDDGAVVRGGSRYGLLPRPGSSRRVNYLAYELDPPA